MNKLHLSSVSLGLCGCVLLAGCSGQPLAEVKGTVTMGGKGIANVKVEFHPDPDKGTSGPGSAGTTDEQGKFSLTYNNGKPGAIVGHHRVVLTDLDVFGNVFVGRGDYRKDDDGKISAEVPKKARFPDKYSDLAQTPFREEVKPGMGTVAFDIKQ